MKNLGWKITPLLVLTLAGLLLGSCPGEIVSGPQVKVSIMLDDVLSPTTTINVLSNGADNTSAVKNATVSVQLNSGAQTTVPYVDGFGYYLSGNISGAEPQAGDTITARITFGSTTIVETVAVPGVPAVNALSGPQNAGSAITLTWPSVTSPPSQFQIAINDTYTVAAHSLGVFYQNIAGTSTSYTISAGTLKAGTSNIRISVSAQNTTPITGTDMDPYSAFTISNFGGITFNTL
jgi:hypothetical protein